MPDASQRIQKLAESFLNELRAIARDEVIQMLGGDRETSKSTVRDSSTTAPTTRRPKGEKRDPADLEALQQRLLAFVTKNPGQSIEKINVGMGTGTKELQLPVRKLITSKALRAVGHKRSTKYFPGKAKMSTKARKK